LLLLLEGGTTSTIYEDGFDDVYLVKLALFYIGCALGY